MRVMTLPTKDSFWQHPDLHNRCYVLGFEFPESPEELSLVLHSNKTPYGATEHFLSFWRGPDSEKRIDEYVATDPPPAQVVIWEVSIPWLYLWIWLRRDRLTAVVASNSSEENLVVYQTQDAMLALQILQQGSQMWAHGFLSRRGETVNAALCQDELVTRNFVLRQFTPDPMSRIFYVSVECPYCHRIIELPETVYLGWRLSILHSFPCSGCGENVRESHWAKAKCPKCARETGDLPAPVADAVNLGCLPEFECAACLLEAGQISQRGTQNNPVVRNTNGPSSNGSTGCFLMLTIIASSVPIVVIAMLLAFGFSRI